MKFIVYLAVNLTVGYLFKNGNYLSFHDSPEGYQYLFSFIIPFQRCRHYVALFPFFQYCYKDFVAMQHGFL